VPRVAAAAFVTLLASIATAHADSRAPAVHVLTTSLEPLIRAAASSGVQFAVPVPHAASTDSDGAWTVAGGRATWRYAVQVPTAVSLSFHASDSFLPESATLLVTGAGAATSYSARDLRRGELWSRIHAGDTLELALSVAAADRARVALRIVSLQAGYRAIGPGVDDHPVYKLLVPRAAAAQGHAACVSNYACEVTAGDTPPGSATVALVVENLYQCTGTLINDVPGDGTPYVLTARHCQTGKLGGGNPGAAATVMVYWDGSSECGAPLGSIYDGQLPMQTGARTVVEQQDAWLIELDANPPVADAQFAGFDVSGGAVQGGYTIHHAQGRDKQFVSWFGRAYALTENGALGTSYRSSFLETVNQTGNIAPGSSGSGLFDQNNHLVGSLTLGRSDTDASGYEACPVASPAAPDGANGAADFTSLAAVWSSTADPTSSTGGATLGSALDPAGTGIQIVPSMHVRVVTTGAPPPPAPRISFNPVTVAAGQSFTVVWAASNAANCALSGGIPGGTWGGSVRDVPPSGSATEAGPAGHYTFGLTCWGADPKAAPVTAESTLTIAPRNASFRVDAGPAAPAAMGGRGGGGTLGVLEAAALAVLLGIRAFLRMQRSARRLPVGRRRRIG
jgi:hypothetical protein